MAVLITPTHVYRRDHTLARDYRGRAYCWCGLPEQSARHAPPPPRTPGDLDGAELASGERPDR